MSLQLIKGEEIVWKSFPGKNYRSMNFYRDIFLSLFIAAVFYMFAVQFKLEFISERAVLLVSIGLVALGALFAAFHQINFLFLRYYITTDRVVIVRGFLSRKMVSVKLEHIQDTKVSQSFFERTMNTGTIYIFTANDSNAREHETDPLNKLTALQNIDKPFQIHAKLEELLDDSLTKK